MQKANDIRKWFLETQALWFIEHGVPVWFHGLITREDAENFLKNKTPGSFLVRVSESRIGYSLSYSAVDRCRHFKIDVLGDGRFVVVGVPDIHETLEDLVKFHQGNPIKPYNELLTQPCGQKCTSQNDYEDLFDSNKSEIKTDPRSPKPGVPLHDPQVQNIGWNFPPPLPQRNLQEKNPPSVPPRTTHSNSSLKASCPLPPPPQTSGANRLYPSIAEEMKSNATAQDSTSILSGLYPWKNKMTNATGTDSLPLDTKSEKLPQKQASSSEGQKWKESDILPKASSDNIGKNKKPVHKLLNPAKEFKEFKNKVLPAFENTVSAMNNIKIPLSPKLVGVVNKKRTESSGTKTNAESICSGPPTGQKCNITSNQKNSPAFGSNHLPCVPNHPTGAQNVGTLNQGVEKEGNANDPFVIYQYKRPPPFAPGF
ncbi:hypothetical protein NDU88_005514 [Pleurodeles waltl]|uniref:SH2 domain-containing protein n=1 Tax=Pleurodeles waltl TaxID=8319 RepID=A0AAV7L102_PLEWA|nr:hypothetical protein NDU88_005514 [Pleurodeles waltl]